MKISFEKLEKIMMEHGHDSSSLAKASGISRQAISSWKNSQRGIRMGNVKKLTEALHCDISDLCEDTTITSGGNSINHSHIGGDVTQTVQHQSADAVETFRAGLIAKIILLDGDAATKDAILKVIATFGKTE